MPVIGTRLSCTVGDDCHCYKISLYNRGCLSLVQDYPVQQGMPAIGTRLSCTVGDAFLLVQDYSVKYGMPAIGTRLSCTVGDAYYWYKIIL